MTKKLVSKFIYQYENGGFFMRELRNTKIIAVDAPEKEGINHAEQYPQHKPAILYDVSPFSSGHGNKRNCQNALYDPARPCKAFPEK